MNWLFGAGYIEAQISASHLAKLQLDSDWLVKVTFELASLDTDYATDVQDFIFAWSSLPGT